ncbi:MAG: Rnf-Nqr domain containing protein [Spirochaetia bacterium]|jgi:Na+-translocating ferredoxin:NAD+ oxidoreductase RnfE subunit|nr:Rnf-Nqr domain containing protein [Spirochaetia bacterium]
MERSDAKSSIGAWAALAGLAPLYVFSNGLSIGLALGVSFLIVHSSASAIALLLPARFGRLKIYALAILGAAIAASIVASIVRLLDPFLFETSYRRIFLVVLMIPVLRAARMPSTMYERERGFEDIVRGLGYGLSVIVFAALREFLASGTISIQAEVAYSSLLPMFAQPAGAFILLGLVAAGFRAIMALAKGTES